MQARPVILRPGEGKARTGDWIGEGWSLVKDDLGTWALMSLVFGVVSSAVPVVAQGPMMAGYHMSILGRLRGRRPEIGDLFKGFSYFVPTLLASLAIGLLVFCGTLLCLIPGLVLAAAYKFTYLFIFDKRLDFWPAMQASHEVVKRDYFGFTMFLLALVLLNFVGVLCCIVGVLVTIPITYTAITVAYRDLVGFEPDAAL
jgi:uncharacterized membrane protein